MMPNTTEHSPSNEDIKQYWVREVRALLAEGVRLTDRDLSRAMGYLRPKQRQALIWHLTGLKQGAIAEKMGVHRTEVSRLIKRAQSELPGLVRLVLEEKIQRASQEK
ncbi:Sigma-70, region 4 [compost metagenome]